jgi:NAD(P)-dependent dehydrogenase (short-subunit alcohol dehydrogenase family)
VSNAAVNPTAGPLLETPRDAFGKIYDINVGAALAIVQVGDQVWGLGVAT